MFPKNVIKIIPAILVIFLSGCELFEFSPYDDSSDKKLEDLNNKNIEKVSNILSISEKDSFDFAVFSDSHTDYKDLYKAVRWVNNKPEIKFVVHLGDQTDTGLKYEFENTTNEMQHLKIPFIVIIGNHDYLSQGSKVYDNIYGHKNFTFITGSNKFIGFNNVIWENNNNKPDFDWLEKELKGWDGNKFILAHIPDEADQMLQYQQEYLSIIKNQQNLYRLHGHTHHLIDSLPKITAGALRDGMIPIISIRNHSVCIRTESYK